MSYQRFLSRAGGRRRGRHGDGRGRDVGAFRPPGCTSSPSEPSPAQPRRRQARPAPRGMRPHACARARLTTRMCPPLSAAARDRRPGRAVSRLDPGRRHREACSVPRARAGKHEGGIPAPCHQKRNESEHEDVHSHRSHEVNIFMRIFTSPHACGQPQRARQRPGSRHSA